MLIANGLFFKGAWRRKYFAPEKTRVSKFHVNVNDSVNVPYMNSVDRFYYVESARLDAKILRIPYDVRKNLRVINLTNKLYTLLRSILSVTGLQICHVHYTATHTDRLESRFERNQSVHTGERYMGHAGIAAQRLDTEIQV